MSKPHWLRAAAQGVLHWSVAAGGVLVWLLCLLAVAVVFVIMAPFMLLEWLAKDTTQATKPPHQD